jgi:hypothetical protein
MIASVHGDRWTFSDIDETDAVRGSRELLKYAIDSSYVASLKSAPTAKPSTDSGVGWRILRAGTRGTRGKSGEESDGEAEAGH